MKAQTVARKNGMDPFQFDEFVVASGLGERNSIGQVFIPDEYVLIAISEFSADPADRAARIATLAAESPEDRTAHLQALIAEKEEREKAEREEQDKKQRAEEEGERQKQRAMAAMLITSGFNFDGYRISRYSGYISGDDAIEVDRESQGLFGGRYNKAGDGLMAALVETRRNALNELKEAAYALGCNAVIGVDFDYITLEPETAGLDGRTVYLPYIIGVTANGNAVVIEKEER